VLEWPVLDEVAVLRIATVVGESREGISAAIEDALTEAQSSFPGLRLLEIGDIVVRVRQGMPVVVAVCRVVYADNC
jgi:flavin-binding protein dodecin